MRFSLLGNVASTLLLASSAWASPLVSTSESSSPAAAAELQDRANIGKRSFTGSCNQCIELTTYSTPNVLRCNCRRSDGVWQHTSLDLNLCITNNQGHLQWKRNGWFSPTCASYQYSTGAGGTIILWTQCVNGNGQWFGNGLTLNEQVHNYNGVLGCNSVPW
ncbi:Cyanovirin-N [Rhypophila sp. PSN 637]